MTKFRNIGVIDTSVWGVAGVGVGRGVERERRI